MLLKNAVESNHVGEVFAGNEGDLSDFLESWGYVQAGAVGNPHLYYYFFITFTVPRYHLASVLLYVYG